MATVINITDLVNGSVVNNDWSGTGVFDELMSAVNSNINLQYSLGRINAADYAQVYLGGIQSVISQSIQYLLQKDLIAAQIDGALADNLIKAEELAIRQAELTKLQYEIATLLPDQHNINVAQQADLAASTLLKTQQEKATYTERVIKDKQAADLGLDDVIKSANVTPEAVYTPKYNEVP